MISLVDTELDRMRAVDRVAQVQNCRVAEWQAERPVEESLTINSPAEDKKAINYNCLSLCQLVMFLMIHSQPTGVTTTLSVLTFLTPAFAVVDVVFDCCEEF